MSKTSGNQNYDFGPFEDDYRGYGPDEGEGARGPLILALAGGVVLIFGAVIWNTYKEGIRSEAGALPIVYADSSPIKRAPENPGGTIVPDQERRIYGLIDGSDEGELLQGGPPINLRPGEETDLDEETGIPRAALPQVEALGNLDNVPDAVASEPLGELPEPAPAPQAEPTLELPSAKFAFNATGDYLVQVAALRTQAAADAAWGKMTSTHPGFFTGAEKRVQRADLGAKGVFYRLRIGAFAERPDASEFCDALKDRGETCIVVSG